MTRVFLSLWLAIHVSLPAGAAPRRSGLAARPDEPPVVLVGGDVEPAPILVRANAPAQERQAAVALGDYLARISGKKFAILTAGKETPGRCILVGEVGLTPPKEVSREGFLIRTEGGRLHICGGSPHATLFGVFAFLEEQAGCRWWSWNEEDVPRRDTLEVRAQDTHIEPAFRQHDVFNREAQQTQNHFAWKLRTVSLTQFTGGHNLCPMLEPHAREHPEFLPMDSQGQRKANNIHLNYTAIGMDTVLARLLSEEVKKRKGKLDGLIYFAGMGDWYGGMDLSPASKAVYEEETWTDPDGRKKPGYTATLLRMMNRTAELLEKEHPGIEVGTFAYMSLEAPPAKTRPRENLAIRLPRLRHDTVRSVLESEKNASFRRNLDRWCEIAPGRVYVWEYGANFQNFLKPFPCLRSLAENIRYYHKVGVAGVSIQGNYVSTGGDLAVLKNHVWAKLLWDPSRDVDELVREFCRGYYGPAAEEMLAYVALMEGSVRGPRPISADEFDTKAAYLTPAVVDRGRSLLDRALARVGGAEPWLRRVKEAEASLEAWLLWRPGPLVEEGERLVRRDLGGDTFARAQSLLRYCREAAPKEWGNGPRYHMSFLTMHGGPLAVLRQGPVTAKVAPVQNGQLRGVLYQDRVVLDEAHVSLALDSVTYEMTRREGSRVEMRADLGVAMWGGRGQKQTGYQTVELGGDGVLRCRGWVERIGQRFDENQAVFVTTYKVDRKPDEIEVRYGEPGRPAQLIKVDAETPTADIPAAAHLRITRRPGGVVIDDRYLTPAQGEVVGKVVFDPKEKTVTVSVTLPVTRVAAEGRTLYGTREIRVEPIER